MYLKKASVLSRHMADIFIRSLYSVYLFEDEIKNSNDFQYINCQYKNTYYLITILLAISLFLSAQASCRTHKKCLKIALIKGNFQPTILFCHMLVFTTSNRVHNVPGHHMTPDHMMTLNIAEIFIYSNIITVVYTSEQRETTPKIGPLQG